MADISGVVAVDMDTNARTNVKRLLEANQRLARAVDPEPKEQVEMEVS
jgi:hypothetical protein